MCTRRGLKVNSDKSEVRVFGGEEVWDVRFVCMIRMCEGAT